MLRLGDSTTSSIQIASPKTLDLKIGVSLHPTRRNPHPEGCNRNLHQIQIQFSTTSTTVLKIATILLAITKTAQHPASTIPHSRHRAQWRTNDRGSHAAKLRTETPSEELILHTQLNPAHDSAPTAAKDDPVNLTHSPPRVDMVQVV